MSTIESASVEARLSRLEKENRRLKWAGLTMIVGFVGVIAGGAAFEQIPNEIVTRRLVVLGPHNDPRIILNVNPDGVMAGIDVMKPDNGLRVVGLGVTPQGDGRMTLWDAEGGQTYRVPNK